jgi:CBS domain-containing protein
MGMVIGKQVEDVMTTDVATVGPATSIVDIVRVILDRRLSGLPVIDDRDRVVGVISEADLLLIEEYRDSKPPTRFESGHRRAERAKASGTMARDMTSPAITTPVGTSVFEAARVMHKNGVKRLPVVNTAGKLVGIVTRSDLLKVFVPTDKDIRLSVEYGLLDALWAALSGKVTVAVDDGVVTLSGRMELRSEVDLLAKLTGSLDGVVSVINRLGFRNDDLEKAPLQPAAPSR